MVSKGLNTHKLNHTITKKIPDNQFSNNLGSYNNFYNILRLFDVLQIFSFTTSETMHTFYL